MMHLKGFIPNKMYWLIDCLRKNSTVHANVLRFAHTLTKFRQIAQYIYIYIYIASSRLLQRSHSSQKVTFKPNRSRLTRRIPSCEIYVGKYFAKFPFAWKPIEMSNLPGDVKCDRTFTNSHLAICEGCLSGRWQRQTTRRRAKGARESRCLQTRISKLNYF